MATATSSRFLALVTPAALGLALAIAPARANIVVNGSFETPSVGTGYMTYGAGGNIGGWTVDAAVDQLGSNWQAAAGTQSVDLNAVAPGSIHQDLATSSGATYVMRFALAGNPDTFCPQPIVARMSVQWGGSEVARPTFDTTGRTMQDMGWTYSTRSVTAAAATTRLGFASLDPQGACGPALDDVSVVETSAPSRPPPPTLGRTVSVYVVKGEVFVKLPAGASQKGTGFEPLTEARTIPVRSILDTREGTVALRAARNRRGRLQSGRFSAGVFQVLQSRKRSAKGLTTLAMRGSKTAFRRCDGSRTATAEASRLSRRAIRRLRARARGRYRTRGRRSAATVRGTVWTTTDSCAGTLTAVKRGEVAVRDFRRKRTIVLTRGKQYLARAPE